MTPFIHLFIAIYHLTLSHATTTTNHLPSIYNSYHFNLNNVSQWLTTTSNQTISCTLQIPSLCIQYNPSLKQQQFNILYKNISFNLIQPSHDSTTIQPQNPLKPLRRRLRSRCRNILYQKRRRTRPRKNHRIRNINFEDNMIFSLTIRVNSFPRRQWGNIIHCGSRNTIRQPAIWINKYTKKFHVVYGTKRNWNQLRNSHFKIRLGKKYKIEYRIRRNRYDVYINGRRFNSVRATHHKYRNQPCYLSDPWYEAANVYVENLKIIRGTNPNGGCKRRHSHRPRVRRRPIESVRSYYKRLHKIGKQIGKILNHGDTVGDCKDMCKRKPVGGWIIGWPAPAGYGHSEHFLSGITGGRPQMAPGMTGMLQRRLMDDMSGDMRGLYMKKCVTVDGMNEICVVYFYVDGSMGLEYNVLVNGSGMEKSVDIDVDRNAYVWIWNEYDGDMCNNPLLEVIDYIICIEEGSDGVMDMIVNDRNGLEVDRMGLKNDERWDKVYKMDLKNGMDIEKRMCKYVGVIEICVDVVNDYRKLQIIVKDIDKNIVDK